MTIKMDIRYKTTPEINGVPVIIDGSLHIDVMDGEKVVGEAYFCAPGFDETNLKKVGFVPNIRNSKTNTYTIIAVPIFADFDKDKKFKIRITPVNVWMIEQ